jgi:hypothetical protein
MNFDRAKTTAIFAAEIAYAAGASLSEPFSSSSILDEI